MKKFWIKKGLMIILFSIAAILVFGAVVMGLWNAILPAVLGVKAITFVQALGILLLSKLLFGGFSGGRWSGGRRDHMWKQKMNEKWTNMSPEQRDQFKSEWRNRCGGRWMQPKREEPGMKAE